MRAASIERYASLRRQVRLSEREASLFAEVGAERAAKHFRKRAARLRYRLRQIERDSS